MISLGRFFATCFCSKSKSAWCGTELMIYGRYCVRLKWTFVAKAILNEPVVSWVWNRTDLGKVDPSLYSDSKEYSFLPRHFLAVYMQIYQITVSEHFRSVTGILPSAITFEKGIWSSYCLWLGTMTKSQKNNRVFNKENVALKKWSILQLCCKLLSWFWANCSCFRAYNTGVLWCSPGFGEYFLISATFFFFLNTELKTHVLPTCGSLINFINPLNCVVSGVVVVLH